MNKAGSKGHTSYDIGEFCDVLRHSRKALDAYISSVELYTDTVGVPHRYLILQVPRNGKRTLYIRLDRRRDHKQSVPQFFLNSSGSVASDGVSY